jgi:hypothetical protein
MVRLGFIRGCRGGGEESELLCSLGDVNDDVPMTGADLRTNLGDSLLLSFRLGRVLLLLLLLRAVVGDLLRLLIFLFLAAGADVCPEEEKSSFRRRVVVVGIGIEFRPTGDFDFLLRRVGDLDDVRSVVRGAGADLRPAGDFDFRSFFFFFRIRSV